MSQHAGSSPFHELWAFQQQQQLKQLAAAPHSSSISINGDNARTVGSARAMSEAQIHMAAACDSMAASTAGTAAMITAWESQQRPFVVSKSHHGAGGSASASGKVPALALGRLQVPIAAPPSSSNWPAADTTGSQLVVKQHQQQKPKIDLAFGRRVEPAGSPRAGSRSSSVSKASGMSTSYGSAVDAQPAANAVSSTSRRGSGAGSNCNSPRAARGSVLSFGTGRSPLCLPPPHPGTGSSMRTPRGNTAAAAAAAAAPAASDSSRVPNLQTPRETRPSSAHHHAGSFNTHSTHSSDSKKSRSPYSAADAETIHLNCNEPPAPQAAPEGSSSSRRAQSPGRATFTFTAVSAVISAEGASMDEDGNSDGGMTPRRLLQNAAAAFSSLMSAQGGGGGSSAHKEQRRSRASAGHSHYTHTAAASAAPPPPRASSGTAASSAAAGSTRQTQLVLRNPAAPRPDSRTTAAANSEGVTWQVQADASGVPDPSSVGSVFQSLNSSQAGGDAGGWFTPQGSATGATSTGPETTTDAAAAAAARQARNRAYEQAMMQAAAAGAATGPQEPCTPLDTARATGNTGGESAPIYSSAHTSFNGCCADGELMPAAVLEHLRRQQQPQPQPQARAPRVNTASAGVAATAAAAAAAAASNAPAQREILLRIAPGALPFLAARAFSRKPVRLIITPDAVFGDFDGASMTSAPACEPATGNKGSCKGRKKGGVGALFRRGSKTPRS